MASSWPDGGGSLRDDDRRCTIMRFVRFFGLIVLLAASVRLLAGEHAATPQQVFDQMHANFHPDKARGLHARYQFDLTGPGGGSWFIEVNDGHCHFGHGRIQNPDLTMIASASDWVGLSNGTLNGTWAYFTGRLKVHGPHALARKLDEMF